MNPRHTLSIFLLFALLLTAAGCAKSPKSPVPTVVPSPVPEVETPASDAADAATPVPAAEYTPAPLEPSAELPLFSDDYYAVISIEGTQYAVYNCMGEVVAEFSQTVDTDYFSNESGFCALYPRDALVGSYDLGRLEFSCRAPDNSYAYSHGTVCIDDDAMKLRALDEDGNERYSIGFEFEEDAASESDGKPYPYFLLGGILGFGGNDIVFISSRELTDYDLNNIKPIPPSIYSKDGKLIRTLDEDTLGGALLGTLGEYLFVQPDGEPEYNGFRLVDGSGKTIMENVSAIASTSFSNNSELPIFIFEARYVCDSEGVVYDSRLERCEQLERYSLENLLKYDDDWGFQYSMFPWLTGCNPDGSVPGSLLYESRGISCYDFAPLRNYKNSAGCYGNADEYIYTGVNEDRSRMLLHTAQGEDYILNLDDSGMHLECVIDGAALFLSEGRQRFELVSLETGETLMTTDCQLYSFGESLIIFRSKSDTDTYTETYFVYNSDGELTLETVANEVRTTYDDKLIIKRGAYTGIADMYGRWLLRGPSVMLYKI